MTDVEDRARQRPAAVECRGLWKIFSADRPETEQEIVRKRLGREAALERFGAFVAVKDVSFSIAVGEIFCVMGLSGSGKSTVLRHINRLIEPSAGSILIDGADILGTAASELRRLRAHTIGMVFQNVALFPHRSVRYNVGYGLKVQGVSPKERARIVEETLALVQLQGWGDRYPQQLSGGMQQRVGLARALACDPKILLMDEPFSALDPLIRRQLQDEFKPIWRSMRKSVLFITHDLEEAMRLGDRIAIMKDGEFVQVGTPAEIALAPATDYVAEFVRSAPKLRFMTAAHVMVPIGDADRRDGPTCSEAAPLLDVIDMVLQSEAPVLVAGAASVPVGIVSRADVLEAVRKERRD